MTWCAFAPSDKGSRGIEEGYTDAGSHAVACRRWHVLHDDISAHLLGVDATGVQLLQQWPEDVRGRIATFDLDTGRETNVGIADQQDGPAH